MKSTVPFCLFIFLVALALVPSHSMQLVSAEDSAKPAEQSSREEADHKDKEDTGDAPTKRDSYSVVIVSVGNGQWSAVRYQKRSGKSWSMEDGKWVAIKEVKQLRPDKPSNFEVQVVPALPGRFSAIRIDRNSGQSWELKEDTWHPILDVED